MNKALATSAESTTQVWDILVRIFHWSLVSAFVVAWVSEDDFETLHFYAGYTVVALVAFRLVWGVIGTRHARFTDFVVGPRAGLRYLKQMAAGGAPRYLGHNPAGALMIVALLVFLSATAFFGMTLLAIEGQGPFAGTFLASLPEDPTEEIHESFANGTLLLVLLHVAGVIVSSVMHRENLILSMVHGRKRNEVPAEESVMNTGGIES